MAIEYVDERIPLVIVLVADVVEKVVQLAEPDRVTNGIVVVNVVVIVVVLVVVVHASKMTTFAIFCTPFAPEDVKSAALLPLRLIRLFCEVQLTLFAANCSMIRCGDNVNWFEKSVLATWISGSIADPIDKFFAPSEEKATQEESCVRHCGPLNPPAHKHAH